MKKFIFTTLTYFLFSSFTFAASNKYNLYHDCKGTWKICVSGWSGSWSGEDSIHHVGMFQMNNEKMDLYDQPSFLIFHQNAEVWLSLENQSFLLGHLTEHNGSASKFTPLEGFSFKLNFRSGPVVDVCNPVNGPLGSYFFQHDRVKTKIYQLIISDREGNKVSIESKKPQLIFPPVKSTVNRKRCN